MALVFLSLLRKGNTKPLDMESGRGYSVGRYGGDVMQWQLVSDETPSDVILLLGWHGFGDKWETTTDYYNSTRGGWYHGSATHWMPLPDPPK